MTADVVIAGAGLAGACAALALAPSRRVIVLDDGRPGASHAAAGLVNPFLGRKAKRAWRATEALTEVARLGTETGVPVDLRGLLRPARDTAQAAVFRERAAKYPNALDWLSTEASAERWPDVVAPHGALWVREGGHVEIPALVGSVLRAAEAAGAEVVRARLAGWVGGSPLTLWADADLRFLSRGEKGPDLERSELTTRRLLLCTGDGTRALAPDLPLHRVKGQTVRFGLAGDAQLPAVSGGTYVVPVAPREVVIGATFEHAFETLDPTPDATARLHREAAEIVPALAEAEVLEARAGVRLTVPASARPGRLPLVGPTSKQAGVWVFTGLGAKGLLTAPLLARQLAAWWDAPETIWPEVSTLAL